MTGFFITLEGPSGIGKTTIAAHLTHLLAAHGLHVLATREPTVTPLGDLARFGTHRYRGEALACLVAADRYHHLREEIEPALARGFVVVCDRYIASSLVLQRLDGVPGDFVWNLHARARCPDLTVILIGDPVRSRGRAEARGTYSRFHHGGAEAGRTEAGMYLVAAGELEAAGHQVLRHDIGDRSPEQVADALAAVVLTRLTRQPEAAERTSES